MEGRWWRAVRHRDSWQTPAHPPRELEIDVTPADSLTPICRCFRQLSALGIDYLAADLAADLPAISARAAAGTTRTTAAAATTSAGSCLRSYEAAKRSEVCCVSSVSQPLLVSRTPCFSAGRNHDAIAAPCYWVHGAACDMLQSHARSAVLRLQSSPRIPSLQRPTTRPFSASAPRKDINFVEIIAAPPLAVLNGVHAIGLPWYAAIPATALLIRGIFGYYASAVPSRRRSQARLNLQPVLHASQALDMQNGVSRGKERWQRMADHMQKVHRYGKPFGGGIASALPLVNFATLIATSEAIRMKCGARDGLLSLIAVPFESIGRLIAPGAFRKVEDGADVRAQEIVERLEQVRQVRSQQTGEQLEGGGSAANATPENMYEAVQPIAPPFVNTEAPHFDPSMKLEGLEFCTDLTAMDYSLILPSMTVGVMVLNVVLQQPPPRVMDAFRPQKSGLGNFIQQHATPMKGLQLGIISIFGMALSRFPAALCLYFFSSVAIGLVQRIFLDIKMPLRRPIRRCVRPNRIRARKAWTARQ